MIDFGSISVLDQGYFSKFVIAVRCLAMGDFAKYVDVYLTLLSGIPNIDIDAMKKEAVQELEEWEAIADVKSVPYEQRSVLHGRMRAGWIHANRARDDAILAFVMVNLAAPTMGASIVSITGMRFACYHALQSCIKPPS